MRPDHADGGRPPPCSPAGCSSPRSAPFDHAFAAQHGAHLTAQFDAAKATAGAVAATAHAAGVTAAAGPFRGHLGQSAAAPLPRPACRRAARCRRLTIVRPGDAGGPVDDLTLTGGHWATGPGEIVLRRRPRDRSPSATGCEFPGVAGQPDADRRRPRPLGRARPPTPGCRRRRSPRSPRRAATRLPDALPLRHTPAPPPRSPPTGPRSPPRAARAR